MNNEEKYLKEKTDELGERLTACVNEYLDKLNEIHNNGEKIFTIIENSMSCVYFSFMLSFCQKEGLYFTNKLIELITCNFNDRIKHIKNIMLENIY